MKTTTSVALRLRALDAPTMELDKGQLVVGAQGDVRFPMPAFLIEHEQGLVLFDTSFTPDLNDDPHAVLGDLADALKIETEPGHRIDTQINKLGFDLEAVTHVVLSHAHIDHAGGLSLFPHAKFVIGPGEFEWSRNPSEKQAHLYRPEDTQPAEGFDWTVLQGPELDLFGDGSIRIFHTPGHTPGQLSCLVSLGSQKIMLTGDTVHLREAWDWEAPNPDDWDPQVAVESIKLLKQIVEAEDARLWIGHDPLDWTEFGGPLFPHE